MFLNIVFFELQCRLKRISTYIYFGLFLFIGFMAIWRGSHGSGILQILVTAGIGNVKANAPFALYYLITMISNFGILITAAFFGNAAFRDFKHQTYGLYFSYPVKKINYIAGRYTGALLSALFVFSAIGIGALLASISPIVNPEKMGQINMIALIQPYLIGVLPNLIFTGAVFFSLVLLTRKFFPIYLGMVVLFVCYSIGQSFAQNQNFFIAALTDPFGQLAAKGFSNYWTAAQKNILLIPLSGNLLFNRIVWSVAGIIILIFTYYKFEFSQIVDSTKQKFKHSIQMIKTGFEIKDRDILDIKITRAFNFRNYVKQTLNTSFHEFKGLVNNVFFLSILVLGIIFMFIMGFRNVGLIRGVQTYILTSQMLDTTDISLYLFSLIIILFCSGELVWRERNKKVQEFYDPLPIPEWVPFVGKLGAIVLIQVLIMLVIMVSGIVIQALHGYYHFELGLYLKELFGMRLPYYLLISVFAMFIQVIVNKKILGYVVTFLFIDDLLPALGLKHHLWRFASTPSYTYSDMNGYGPFVKPILTFDLYWSFFAVLLIVLSIIFWVRGNDTRMKDRIKTVKTRLTTLKLRIAGVALAGCFITGSFIVYNTNILNKFETTESVEEKSVDYELKYKSYENVPQPRIVDVKINVDLYPYQRSLSSNGRMLLKNKTDVDIKEVFIHVYDKVKINQLELDAPNSLKESSKEHGNYIFTLTTPLKPGEKMVLRYDVELSVKGFKNHAIDTKIVRNGTMVDWFHFMPSLGYNPHMELENNDKRKTYGLKPKAKFPSINNEKARMNMPIANDADWVNFEAVVSTNKNQTALTSGELIKEWLEGDRRYFHYKTSHKITKQFIFLSAEYSVKKDEWQDIGIEIYYRKAHEYNIDRMIKAAKKSLEYYSKNFSPYQFKHITIAEFPRYQIFALGLPNIIPFSEGMGFIAKINKDDVDYVFGVTAHEVAHQWWGKQVMGANVQGWTLMNEVLAQYSSLMVSKREYDQENTNRYIKRGMDRYLRGRANETEKEMPLTLSEHQAYIHYGKGLVVMNALQNYIGEDSVNAALKRYVKDVAFQEPPYTTSLEFLEYIKEATPDSLQYIITDMFETITLYDNKATIARCQKMENGKYQVKINFEAKKIRADELGNETVIKVNDYITFGVFGADGEELYLKKHFVNAGKGELEITVDNLPEKVGIDPYYYLIDKNTDNNLIDVDEETSEATSSSFEIGRRKHVLTDIN